MPSLRFFIGVLALLAGGSHHIDQRPQNLGDAGIGGSRQLQRRLATGAFQLGHLAFEGFRVHCIGFGQGDNLKFLGQIGAIGLQLVAHGFVGFTGMVASGLHQMQQHCATLDMA